MRLTKHDAKRLKDIKVVLIIVLAIGLAVASWYAWGPPARQRNVRTYQECVASGGVIFDSAPAMCRTHDGHMFRDPYGCRPQPHIYCAL